MKPEKKRILATMATKLVEAGLKPPFTVKLSRQLDDLWERTRPEFRRPEREVSMGESNLQVIAKDVMDLERKVSSAPGMNAAELHAAMNDLESLRYSVEHFSAGSMTPEDATLSSQIQSKLGQITKLLENGAQSLSPEAMAV